MSLIQIIIFFFSSQLGGQIPDTLAHGKESIAINIKSKQGIELIKKLSSKSDVLIEPFRKGFEHLYLKYVQQKV